MSKNLTVSCNYWMESQNYLYHKLKVKSHNCQGKVIIMGYKVRMSCHYP